MRPAISQPIPPMCVNGKTERVPVRRSQVEGVDHRVRGSRDGVVGVTGALRVGGGARRVEEPAQRAVLALARRERLATGRRRRERGDVAVEHVAPMDLHHLQSGCLPGDRPGHRAEIEAAPLPRHHEQLGARFADHEADLTVPVDRQDRVLHRTQPGQTTHENHRLDPGGQLPGDDVALADSSGVERGGRLLRGVAVLREGEGAPVLVDDEPGVGGVAGPLPRSGPTATWPRSVVVPSSQPAASAGVGVAGFGNPPPYVTSPPSIEIIEPIMYLAVSEAT